MAGTAQTGKPHAVRKSRPGTQMEVVYGSTKSSGMMGMGAGMGGGAGMAGLPGLSAPAANATDTMAATAMPALPATGGK